MIGHRQAAVERVLLGDETDPAELGRALARAGAEHADAPGGGFEQPDRQAQQRGLAGAVRPDQTDDPPLRHLDRAIAQRPPLAVALAQPVRFEHRAHATPSLFISRKVS